MEPRTGNGTAHGKDDEMTKRLVAKVGEYTKDGQTKGRYVNLGVILSNDNGEYVLLDPSVSVSGILSQQNALAAQQGNKLRDRAMVSIFTDQPRDDSQQGYSGQGGYGGPPTGGAGGFDESDIPFMREDRV